jgi:hypothetical protein
MLQARVPERSSWYHQSKDERSQVMRRILSLVVALSVFSLVAAAGVHAADAKAGTLKCVGIYSETDAGSISYRVGTGDWVVVKVGDTIPAAAVLRVNVERDWIEVTPANNPYAVYEITGSDSGDVVKKVADILKGKPKTIAFPKGTKDKADPKFKDKLVVTQYLGRQISMTVDGDSRDIKYGDVLDRTGKVTIIAINNTITLMNANGAVTTVIGPLKFDVEKVLTNQKLYKYLNVLK